VLKQSFKFGAAEAPRLIDEVEAAQRLGTTPKTLQIWRSTKRYPLPYVKVGRLVRYRLADVDAFIESRLVGAGAE